VKLPNWSLVVLGLIGLSIVMVLSKREVFTREGSPILYNASDFQASLKKATELAPDIFRRADNGDVLSDADKEKIREALSYFQAMYSYSPRLVSAYYGAGKCAMILGDYQTAAEKFEQAALNINQGVESDKNAVQLTVTECQGLLSECLLKLSEMQNTPASAVTLYRQRSLVAAKEALQVAPSGFRYLLASGRAKIALGAREAGFIDIKKAISLAPNHKFVTEAAKDFGLIL
jgi:tetratricopeptide (TPR) repeat protein